MTNAVSEALRRGLVLGDGGVEEEARTRGYGVPRVLAEFPHVLRLIHQDYFRAGAQMLRSQTAWTTPAQLERRYGAEWSDRSVELTRTAVRLAREAIEPDAALPAWVAGCLGPLGPSAGADANGTARNGSAGGTSDGSSAAGPAGPAGPAGGAGAASPDPGWAAHVATMIDAGVDLLFCDSFRRLDEARQALAACLPSGLPVIVTVAPDQDSQTLEDGQAVVASARALAADGATVVGLSGTQEAVDLWPVFRELRAAVDTPLALVPFGYRSSRQGWEARREALLISGVELAKFALQTRVSGPGYFSAGGGAGPEIIRKVAQDLGCERHHIALHPR